MQGGPGGISRRDRDIKVVRFSSTGGVDPTFNGAVFDFGAENQYPEDGQALEAQADGKIVVGGISRPNVTENVFGLARLNSDGSLDAGFGGGGRVITRFLGSDQVNALVVQADGKIIAIGSTFDRNTNTLDLALARYLVQ